MAEQAVDKTVFRLQVAEGCSTNPIALRMPLKVKVNSFFAHTKIVERSSTPVWDKTFKFSANPSSMSFLETIHNLPNTKNIQYEVLGTFGMRISTLLDVGKDHIDLKLRPNSDGQNAGVITVRFWSERAANVITADAGQSAAAKSMASVMSKLQVLAKVMDNGAPMYPCTSLVLQVISSVYKVAKNQLDNDRKIAQLVASMNSVYSFTNNLPTSAFAAISHIGNEIFMIIHQTFECLIFMQEYVGCGFSRRALKEVYPGATID
ncbi:hypothetical protein PILCRDRAFT_16886 [Piloderma croceum F 1598]|uniref:C2 domain-containing protein n=1 Tax=Piloderma croceum (strain F 1598) TaxID=765440 RepID=A0A0C3EG75_PILCF|nr:hypothetical protein PILCRDRAFT_16886 [Piloderma croceum F 1598]